MTGETLYPRLEPLLAQIQKPIQYVGGELNSQVKPWDGRRRPLGADVPGRLRGGPAQPGPDDPVRGAQRAPGRPGRAHLRRLAGPRRPHARERRPAVHRRRAPRGRATSTCSASASPPSSATPTCSRRSTSPASRLHAVDRDESHPVVVAGGHAAFNPEPVADFVDCAVLGDGEQVVGDITDVVKAWKAQGKPRRPRRAARPPGPRRRRLRAALLRGLLRSRRRDRRGHPHPGRRPGADRQAHRHGPRRVAVPEDAARAAGRDRCTSG